MLYKLQCYKEAYDRWYFDDESMDIERELFYPDLSIQLSGWSHPFMDRNNGYHTVHIADYQFHEGAGRFNYVKTNRDGDVNSYEYWQPEGIDEFGIFEGTVTFCAVLEQYFPQIPPTIWFLVDATEEEEQQFSVTLDIVAQDATPALKPSH